MTARSTNFLLGLTIGVLLTLALPSSAHFSRNTTYGHDWGHVNALRSQLNDLGSRISALESRASSTDLGVSALKTRVGTVESKVGKLDYVGNYTGTISASKINGDLPSSQIAIPFGCAGAQTWWMTYGSGLTC